MSVIPLKADIRQRGLHVLVPEADLRSAIVVELAFVLVGPFLEDLMRSMAGAGSPIEEKGLIGGIGFVALHPVDGLVRQVLAQVIVCSSCGGSIGFRFS